MVHIGQLQQIGSGHALINQINSYNCFTIAMIECYLLIFWQILSNMPENKSFEPNEISKQ